MNKFKNLAVVLGVSSLILILLVSTASCWNRPRARMAAPAVGPMMGACPPPMMAPGPVPMMAPGPPPCGFMPCPPPSCGPRFGAEVGARIFYSTNQALMFNDNAPDVDFVRDLHLSSGLLVGEVYGAFRMPPRLALSYTFMFPRVDDGWGVLPVPLTVRDTVFPAGTRLATKSTFTLHRWEGEFFAATLDQFRVGPYLMGELLVDTMEVRGGGLSETTTFTEFLMGAGASGEFAPAYNVFVKGKAAYTFLQNQGGVYLDGEVRLFPDFDQDGMAGGPRGFKPYVGVGYRLRVSTWNTTGSYTKTRLTSHGPYASVGVVF